MEYLVSICCITYNHTSFIRQCLDGFLMQETDFAYEILIHDDASTDGTAEIIREYEERYPDIIKPIYQTESQYSKGVKISVTYQFPRAQGKYIALCEGDDYWTDPHKLQKQVDFMEANPEYSLCSHRYRIYDEEMQEWSSDYGAAVFLNISDGITFDSKFNLEVAWLTKTMTVLFRKDAYDSSFPPQYKYWRDVHLFYYILKKGKGYCFNYDAAVYRRHVNGIWSKQSRYDQQLIQYKIYKELYGNNKDDVVLEKLLAKLSWTYYYTVVKPDLMDRKITRQALGRFLSFVWDDFRFFRSKIMRRQVYTFVESRFEKTFRYLMGRLKN